MHKITLYVRTNNHVHFQLHASVLYVVTEAQTFSYFFLKIELFTYYIFKIIWTVFSDIGGFFVKYIDFGFLS